MSNRGEAPANNRETASGDGTSGTTGGNTMDNGNTDATPGGDAVVKGGSTGESEASAIEHRARVVSVDGDSSAGDTPRIKLEILEDGRTMTVSGHAVMVVVNETRPLRVDEILSITFAAGTDEVDRIIRD